MAFDTLVPGVRQLAAAAADAIMAIYRQPFESAAKSDGSPVTAADLAADAVICEGLAALTPAIPVVSEERVAAGAPDLSGGRFWLVDPLDGTREFVSRNDEFTVNIGLVDSGVPVFGCVGIPAQGTIYIGWRDGGAWRFDGGAPVRIAARRAPDEPVAVVSRNHLDEHTRTFLAALPRHRTETVGSAIKFCRVAEGRADLYARFGPTSEWDTAAGHALVLAAGGQLEGWNGVPFRYAKPGFVNGGFVVRGAA